MLARTEGSMTFFSVCSGSTPKMRGTITKSRILQLLRTMLPLQAMANHGLTTAASTGSSETASKHHSHHHQHSPKTRNDVKLFEGDIVPEYGQILECYGANTTAELVAKGVLSVPKDDSNIDSVTLPTTLGSDYYRLWPQRIDDVTLIPYEFAKGAFSAAEQSIVEKAMRDLARQVSVVQFAPRRQSFNTVKKKKKDANHHLPYLRFTADKFQSDSSSIAEDFACWAHVGWKGDSHQVINLGEDFCVAVGPVKHLLLHTLGMWHPSSRWDRDDYVTIVWENVVPGLEYYFRKRTRDDTLGFPYYDYASIMNFENDDFSKNGNDTMLAPEPIGQLDHLSAGDVLWVRLLYQCRSGPRLFDEYLAHPCTEDCPCWQDDESSSNDHDNNIIEDFSVTMSCGGNDAACQGNLVCSPQMDQCIRQRGDNVTGTVTMWSIQAALVPPFNNQVMIGIVVLVAIAFFAATFLLSFVRAARGAGGAGLIALHHRQGYETIP